MASSLRVDEVEVTERGFLLEMISQILQLSYVSCCDKAIWNAINADCEGCAIQHPSQKEHKCIMMDEEEAWNYYYEEAIQVVDSNRVWTLVENVCDMLDIRIHRSWYSYVPELYKLPWTTAYLSFLQIDNFSDRSGHLKQILQVLGNGPLRINLRKKPLTQASSIACPYEFTRKYEHRMDTDKMSKLSISE